MTASEVPSARLLDSGPDRLSWPARLGMAVANPRWALAVAGDRVNSGRASSDVIGVMVLLVLSAHLVGVVTAGWIGGVLGVGLGAKTLIAVLSAALSTALMFLILATAVLFTAGGQRRSFSRAFDLASVALVPVLLVQMVATSVIRLADMRVSLSVNIAVGAIAFGWGATIVVLALPVIRRAVAVRAIPPRTVAASSLWVGRCVVLVAVLLAAIQTVWMVRNSDSMRPMREGDTAPGFQLPLIATDEASSEMWSLPSQPGKPVVIDFWATWCGPCLAAMPEFAKIKVQYGDKIEFLAVNLDDRVKARSIFQSSKYPMRLLFDSQHVADRYGVVNIPHVVVIDATGKVRDVIRGGGANATARLQADIQRLLSP
jgi:thiol-disulfide isomerase/thioredoxin